MFGNNVKTDYIFSSVDRSTVDRGKTRRALESVRKAVRVSQRGSTSDIGISMPSEAKVAQAVTTYLSDPKFADFSVHSDHEIQIGGARYRADIVLCDENDVSDEKKYVAIAECKLQGVSNYGSEPLKSFLCATNAPFGILASGTDINSWYFYENLHHNRFQLIEQSEFETGLLEGLGMPITREFEL